MVPPTLPDDVQEHLLAWLHDVEDSSTETGTRQVAINKNDAAIFKKFKEYLASLLGVSRISFAQAMTVLLALVKGLDTAAMAQVVQGREAAKAIKSTTHAIRDCGFVLKQFKKYLHSIMPPAMLYQWWNVLSGNDANVYRLYSSGNIDGYNVTDFQALEEQVITPWLANGTTSIGRVEQVRKAWHGYQQYMDRFRFLLEGRRELDALQVLQDRNDRIADAEQKKE
jgi:hypothetical protein